MQINLRKMNTLRFKEPYFNLKKDWTLKNIL